MSDFAYSAVNSQGHHVTGVITAANRQAAISALRAQGNNPLSVKEAGAKKIKGGGFSLNKVKGKDLVVFTRELSTMVSAGVPLTRGLETLANQTENKYFKKVIDSINRDVAGGTPLADALGKYPKVFSDVYVNMVRAGEAGGILDEILGRLASQVEKEAAIKKKIRSAMAYPAVISVVTFFSFFGIMLFIMPKISKILTNLAGPGAELPVYSRFLLQVSAFMQHNILFILVISGVLLWLARRYISTTTGKLRWHRLLLSLPVMGPVLTKIAIARFARTFSSLMAAGVAVLESLEVTGKAVGNRAIQAEIATVSEKVKSGQPLGKLLLEANYFPPIVGQMMTVGEETGKVDQILVKLADFYEQDVDALIDGLASIIEPVMIVVLGSVVGLIAVSVMGPIASLAKDVGQ